MAVVSIISRLKAIICVLTDGRSPLHSPLIQSLMHMHTDSPRHHSELAGTIHRNGVM